MDGPSLLSGIFDCNFHVVIPADAGIQNGNSCFAWIPTYVGMTDGDPQKRACSLLHLYVVSRRIEVGWGFEAGDWGPSRGRTFPAEWDVFDCDFHVVIPAEAGI